MFNFPKLAYISSSVFQYGLHVYNNLVSIGKKYGMRHAGYYAMRSLRIEKFYAFWGQDLDSTTTPLECGRGFRVKLNVSYSLIINIFVCHCFSEYMNIMYG